MIQFFCPVRVVPKQSARFGCGRAWRAPKVHANATELMFHLERFRPLEPWDGPIRVTLTFHFEWLKKHCKQTRSLGYLCKVTRADEDNLVKQVMDVLESCGFFHDDSQVHTGEGNRYYTDVNGVMVTLERMEVPW